MKNVIIAVVLATFALGLSSGVRAASCDTIAKATVDQFVAVSGAAMKTPAQKESYATLIGAQKQICLNGVEMRSNEASYYDASRMVRGVIGGTQKAGMNQDAFVSNALSTMTFSMGYTYGE